MAVVEKGSALATGRPRHTPARVPLVSLVRLMAQNDALIMTTHHCNVLQREPMMHKGEKCKEDWCSADPSGLTGWVPVPWTTQPNSRPELGLRSIARHAPLLPQETDGHR